MGSKKRIFTTSTLQLLELVLILLLFFTILLINSFILSIILAGLLLIVFIFEFILCAGRSRRLNIINRKIKEGTEKGLAHFIDLQFDEKESGWGLEALEYNLNLLLQEIKKVFWDIKQNLFTTKINKSTLENIQILMISYIQKVVNIGNVRTQLEGICKGINDATNSTKLILGSIIDLANHTNREAETIKQTSEALEKLLQTISEITGLTFNKQKMAEELKRITKIGQDKVGKTTEIIRMINESTGEMLKIIEIINNIADSTNILSINAGIEAAHAGKQGKGFRVIADEIIKLVESTKKNAGEISALLKDQVNNMTLALEESNGSRKALLEVNAEVQNAADTWIEISNKTIEMSRGTQVIQETTENIFEITKAVSESSEAIKQSVEKINQEASELDEATNKTLDILAKVTVTNEEAKQSTVIILKQLNEMTKFVNKLNKAIDFFNLGKRVFFLFPEERIREYAKAISRKEYEVYLTDNFQGFLKVLKEYPNSIVLINRDNTPKPFVMKSYVDAIKRIPDSRGISIGIITHEKPKENEVAPALCEYLFCKRKVKEENLSEIIEFIEKKRAKGLRKQVRVSCSDKDNIQVILSIHNKQYTGKVRDISSCALLASFPENTRPESMKKRFDFIITFGKRKYSLSATEGVIRTDNDYLIVFSDKPDEQAKNAIYEYIFFKLQEQLEIEMAKG
ncbi:MAG: hypothetical protein JXB88_09565 [Spirochaetales bacterium]|nr:hypothetical protein [Spirochaetales bacterium]